MSELIELTKTLLDDLKVCHQRFLQGHKPEKTRAYFKEIRQDIDPLFIKLERWEKESIDMIEAYHLAMHPQQIQSTKENMQQVVLHSYYIDLRKRRFMELVKSCDFVFEQLVDQLQNIIS